MPAVSDAWSLGVALVSVATSPVMPESDRYVARVAESPSMRRPIEGPLALRDVARGSVVPTVGVAPLVSCLVSFTDDHAAALPLEAFPRSTTTEMLDAIARASEAGTTLDRLAQLNLATRMTSSAFEALIVCHAATRQLARGRDVRAVGRAMSVDERVHRGRSIAAFPASLSRGGDALGDTYHYWANVLAGVTAAQSDPLTRRALVRLFRAGPWLMRTVREGLFGGTLFAGDHALVDHLGLDHGLALARLDAPARSDLTRRRASDARR